LSSGGRHVRLGLDGGDEAVGVVQAQVELAAAPREGRADALAAAEVDADHALERADEADPAASAEAQAEPAPPRPGRAADVLDTLEREAAAEEDPELDLDAAATDPGGRPLARRAEREQQGAENGRDPEREVHVQDQP